MIPNKGGGKSLIQGLREKTKTSDICSICLRDKRREIKILDPATEIIQRCPGCCSPMVWAKTNPYGKREEWEWIRGRGAVVRSGVRKTNEDKPRPKTGIKFY